MRVKIVKDERYSFLSDVNLDTVFDARQDGYDYVLINAEQLVSAGAKKWILEDVEWSFPLDNVKVVTDETPLVDTDCDITNKCCNQFGERDEMQAIINLLQADVIARGARIEELERVLQGEQRKSEQLYNLALELGACSEFMKVNFACNWSSDDA